MTGVRGDQESRIIPYFEKIITNALAADHMIDLSAGLAGAVLLKGLLAPDRCSDFVELLSAADLGAFDTTRYQVQTFHFGPIANHYLPYGRLTDDYWREAEVAERFWHESPLGDLRQQCLARIAEVWPGRIRPGTVDGRDVYWGMVRENAHGAPPHWDEVAREFPPGYLGARPIAQLVFNLYLSMPSEGGDTTIWPRRWQPRDDVHRVGSCWPTLPFDEEPLTVKPEPGDAMLFDPRNYHAVAACRGGRRFALAFYLGITAEGSAIIWS